jgi:hypothetical protein
VRRVQWLPADGNGWRYYLDDEDDLVFYCPDSRRRKFDERQAELGSARLTQRFPAEGSAFRESTNGVAQRLDASWLKFVGLITEPSDEVFTVDVHHAFLFPLPLRELAPHDDYGGDVWASCATLVQACLEVDGCAAKTAAAEVHTP